MFETLESRALFSVTLTAADAPTTEPAAEPAPVVVERDAASGLPTGKRMHKPFVFIHTMDKASPVLM
jgi:hypothetical protein